MEYAGSYALFNYRLVEPSKGLEYDNLRLIRAFEHGLDPTSSEAGFVLVHVDMVQNSGPLVDGVVSALDACAANDRDAFDDGMNKVVNAMTKVNKVMEKMWGKSKPGDYTSFRTFIFGITSQSMFPNGVIYEGVSEEPMSFRGESGANDSMVGENAKASLSTHSDMMTRSLCVTTSFRSLCQTHHSPAFSKTSGPTDQEIIANSSSLLVNAQVHFHFATTHSKKHHPRLSTCLR